MTLAERLAQSRARLSAYIQAEIAILNGAQSYSIDNLVLTRADIRDVRKQVELLTTECSILARGNKIKCVRVRFRDQ